VQAINALVTCRGGLAVTEGSRCDVLPLPIAGLMSDRESTNVAAAYSALDARAKELGSALRAPLMTLSFMVLLVIPALKLSDRGLFDVERFELISLEA